MYICILKGWAIAKKLILLYLIKGSKRIEAWNLFLKLNHLNPAASHLWPWHTI